MISAPHRALLLSVLFVAGASPALAQVVAPASAQAAAAASRAASPTAARPASAAPVQARKPAPARPANSAATRDEAKPTWAELTPEQQGTLGPLAGSWKSLSAPHKRKWVALSENYPKMTPQEQGKLRSRMNDWASLSPQQRTQARFNFQETKRVRADDKKAKWEAYQALSPEEKRKLAAGAAAVKPPPPPTAPAVKPVAPQKLARVPKPQEGDLRAPRIAASEAVEGNTPAPGVPGADLKR